jgi:hypothetical protein
MVEIGSEMWHSKVLTSIVLFKYSAQMGIFASIKSSLLKTTHFAAGFSDDLTTKVIYD